MSEINAVVDENRVWYRSYHRYAAQKWRLDTVPYIQWQGNNNKKKQRSIRWHWNQLAC
jgi:hypothetical protein